MRSGRLCFRMNHFPLCFGPTKSCKSVKCSDATSPDSSTNPDFIWYIYLYHIHRGSGYQPRCPVVDIPIITSSPLLIPFRWLWVHYFPNIPRMRCRFLSGWLGWLGVPSNKARPMDIRWIWPVLAGSIMSAPTLPCLLESFAQHLDLPDHWPTMTNSSTKHVWVWIKIRYPQNSLAGMVYQTNPHTSTNYVAVPRSEF